MIYHCELSLLLLSVHSAYLLPGTPFQRFLLQATYYLLFNIFIINLIYLLLSLISLTYISIGSDCYFILLFSDLVFFAILVHGCLIIIMFFSFALCSFFSLNFTAIFSSHYFFLVYLVSYAALWYFEMDDNPIQIN